MPAAFNTVGLAWLTMDEQVLGLTVHEFRISISRLRVRPGLASTREQVRHTANRAWHQYIGGLAEERGTHVGLLDEASDDAFAHERSQAEAKAARLRSRAVPFPYELLPATKEAIDDFWRQEWSPGRQGTGGPDFAGDPAHPGETLLAVARSVWHSPHPVYLNQHGQVVGFDGVQLSLLQCQQVVPNQENLDAWIVAALIRYMRTLRGTLMFQPPSDDEVQRLAADARFARPRLRAMNSDDVTRFLRFDDAVLSEVWLHKPIKPETIARAAQATLQTEPIEGPSRGLLKVRFRAHGWQLAESYTDYSDDHLPTIPALFLTTDGTIVTRFGFEPTRTLVRPEELLFMRAHGRALTPRR